MKWIVVLAAASLAAGCADVQRESGRPGDEERVAALEAQVEELERRLAAAEQRAGAATGPGGAAKGSGCEARLAACRARLEECEQDPFKGGKYFIAEDGKRRKAAGPEKAKKAEKKKRDESVENPFDGKKKKAPEPSEPLDPFAED
ncbi:MAG: hypothetical protein R6V85_04450 [Polyangia bacterium]